MISKKDELITIETAHTELLLKELDGAVELLYYGARLKDDTGCGMCSILGRKNAFSSADNTSATNTLFSFFGDGNDNEPFLKLVNGKGNFTNKFVYCGCEISGYKKVCEKLPQARDGEQTLTLFYRDEAHETQVNLYISSFSDSDALTFSSEVINCGEEVVYVDRLFSVQLDFDGIKNEVLTLDGAWARERHVGRTELSRGTFFIDSKTGTSSNKHNPFVAVRNAEGRWIAFNPIWSGNHKFLADISPLGQTRLLSGMNDYMMHYPLAKGERLSSPQSVTVNAASFEDASAAMHGFVMKHIVPKRFENRERPVLLNNWEATYFDFDERKLKKLVDSAKELGIEMFVLDDGWFGNRKNDLSSLGDWYDNEAKTGGLDNLAAYARKSGLKFGLWVEPEMISKDSELYRVHPEYAMRLPECEPIEKRWQLMLDLCNEEVVNYVIDSLTKVFDKCRPDYVKWDFNRSMTDVYGAGTYYGRYFYDYTVNLYKLIGTLTERYPETIFEGCASGGNRFDLGILCYMPQIWASDDTDARERVEIQAGTLSAYPQSTMGAHVSASPNHQTHNATPLAERFIVACVGAFGYELDPARLNDDELTQIKEQIVFYKKHRRLLQFGNCRVLENDDEKCIVGTCAEDRSEAIVSVIFKKRQINAIKPKIRLGGFDESTVYDVEVFGRAERFTASGAVLNGCPLDLWYLARENSVNAVSAFMLYIKTHGER